MENQDIRLMIGNIKFSCRAVAIIENAGRILFQKRINDANWALPGGAIATMEKGSEVVLREIEEETGEKNAVVERPLWFAEYFFEFDEKTQHQYILGYKVNLPDDSELLKHEEFKGIEEGKNIIYRWIDKSEIESSPIKPDFVKKKVLNISNSYEYVCESQL